MKIQSMKIAQQYNPSFNGDVIPTFAINDKEKIALEFSFDPSNNLGDSVDFSKALCQDVDGACFFNASSPQKVYMDDHCIFDSKDSLVKLSLGKDSQEVKLDITSERFAHRDYFDKNSTSSKYTIAAVEKLLKKMLINVQEYTSCARHEKLIDTCIDFLKFLHK